MHLEIHDYVEGHKCNTQKKKERNKEHIIERLYIDQLVIVNKFNY